MSLDVASPAPRLLSRLLALRDLGRYPVLRAGGALDVIEIGAGLGDAAALVADELPVNRLALFELSARARRVLSERFDGDARVTIARDVLVGTDRFDLALCFEVMEHVEDDAEFLGTIRDRLHGTGLFIGSVPAHARLWGAGDVLAGHFRRYDEPVLRERLDAAGFDTLEMVGYGSPVSWLQPIRERHYARRLAGVQAHDKLSGTLASGVSRELVDRLPKRPVEALVRCAHALRVLPGVKRHDDGWLFVCRVRPDAAARS